MNFAVILEKIETYIEAEGFTWQQVKNATPKQWYDHAVAAGFTSQELKQFARSKHVLRTAFIERKKRSIFVALVNDLLTHIRKAGTDEEIFPLIKELAENQEDYYGAI